MALGASSRRVLASVVNEGMRQSLLGILAGVGSGLLVGKLLSALLYGVQATDPPTILSVCAVLVAASFLACFLPARRATLNDPMQVLRAE